MALVVAGTDFIQMPAGTTAQRPASPIQGMQRYNTTLGYTEVYTGTAWVAMGTQGASIDPLNYALFTSSGTWTCPAGVTRVYATVVGGGGGATNFTTFGGQGGIGTGYYAVVPGTNYTITIGQGGTGVSGSLGGSGGTSSFSTFLSCTGGTGATSTQNGTRGTATGDLFGSTTGTSLVGTSTSSEMIGPFVGVSFNEAPSNSRVAWTANLNVLPGSPGRSYAVGCGTTGAGGVDGIVLIEYVG